MNMTMSKIADVEFAQRSGSVARVARPRGRRPGKTLQATWIDLRQRFLRVMTFLDTNIDACPNVDQLADVAEMSKFYFIRFFKEHVGETPGQTALRLRLGRAKRRLAAGWKVKDVASVAGYDRIQAFSTAFRNHFGTLPSQIDYVANLPGVPPRVIWLEDRAIIGIPSDGSRIKFTPLIEQSISSLMLRNNGIGNRDVLVVMHELPFFTRQGASLRMAETEIRRTNDPEGVFDTAVPPSKLLTTKGLDRIVIAGGPYLLVSAYGNWESVSCELLRLGERTRTGGGFALRDGPVLWRPVSNPWFTPPSERLRELYLPLKRR